MKSVTAVLLVVCAPALADSFQATCTELRGTAQIYKNGRFKPEGDAFTGATVKFAFEELDDGALGTIRWSDGTEYEAIVFAVNDSMVTFVTVDRGLLFHAAGTYTIYRRDKVLGFSQHKLAGPLREPMISSFYGECQ